MNHAETGNRAPIAVSGFAVVLLLFLKGMNSDAPIYVGLGLSLVIYVSMSLLENRGTHELPEKRRR